MEVVGALSAIPAGGGWRGSKEGAWGLDAPVPFLFNSIAAQIGQNWVGPVDAIGAIPRF